jgi:hypothetical protein
MRAGTCVLDVWGVRCIAEHVDRDLTWLRAVRACIFLDVLHRVWFTLHGQYMTNATLTYIHALAIETH